MLVLRSMGGSLTQLIGSGSAYAGISELCRLMADAMDNEKVTEEVIQFKAWGCHA